MKKSWTLKKFIILSQGSLFILSCGLYYIFRREHWLNDLWNGQWSLLMIVYTGLIAGIGIRLLTMIIGEAWPNYHQIMEGTVVRSLEGIDNWDLILISLIPAIVEEIFFRGLLQSFIGIFFSSLIFAILHWGFVKKLWIYGVHALVISLFFGWLYVSTGSLLTTVVAHFTNNFLAGLYIQGKISLIIWVGK